MKVMITTPLAASLVERIATVPGVEVLWDPALLPPERYACDHIGDLAWRRDADAERRWNAMLAQADVIYGTPRYEGAALRAAIEAAPNVLFVQGSAAGAGSTVAAAGFDRATLERVAFASAAGVHGGTLAEFVFYGLLALRKDARRLATIRERRGWDHYAMGELAGSTLAIVGMGGIGVAIARRARAFEMRVVGVTRTGASHREADACYPVSAMADAFASSDAVAITLPGTEHTARLVDAAALAALPARAIVCNVGRGTVVDQDALVAMLRAGRIAGAVLDVTDPEPLPPDHPLWTMENVVLSPHTAALSLRESERIVDVFIDNLERHARGEPLRNRVDTNEFY